VLLLWLSVSIALVAVALVASRGSGKGACTVPWGGGMRRAGARARGTVSRVIAGGGPLRLTR
jgi:hypothetical protein